MALDFIRDRRAEELESQEEIDIQTLALQNIKDKFVQLLIREGKETKKHTLINRLIANYETKVTFEGKWQEEDAQVEISASVFMDKLISENKHFPIYVQLNMGHFSSQYSLNSDVSTSHAFLYENGEIRDFYPSNFCLGLEQVLEAIHSGQFVAVQAK
ncbi:MAG: hypothetical protein V1810_03865 [Candidatus Beckwithbacteria bacterium]